MPMYVYHCPRCGNVEEYNRPVSQCNRKTKCPECGVVMGRDYGAENTGGKAKQWATGNLSVSMGVPRKLAQNVQEELRSLPGCASVEVTGQGFIKTFSQKQKNMVAKHFGMRDHEAFY